jgi:hypothetical protein
MSEALADALIQYYQRKEALDRAMQEWWESIDKVMVGNKMVPAKAADSDIFDDWKAKIDDLESRRPSVAGIT